MYRKHQLAIIRARNDAARILGSGTITTPGIWALTDMGEVLCALETYDRFDYDNDPWQEHDFGSFVLREEKCFWKIDYYDENLRYWSDPLKKSTRRVITICLAEEYWLIGFRIVRHVRKYASLLTRSSIHTERYV